jgi:hypothetical protein
MGWLKALQPSAAAGHAAQHSAHITARTAQRAQHSQPAGVGLPGHHCPDGRPQAQHGQQAPGRAREENQNLVSTANRQAGEGQGRARLVARVLEWHTGLGNRPVFAMALQRLSGLYCSWRRHVP